MADKDSTSNRTTQKICKAAKATRKACLRSKSRINPKVIANIVFIAPELRKQQSYRDWNIALRAYFETLSNDEQTLVKKCMAFVCAKPEYREHLHGCCPVIPFPIVSKRLAAMEA